MNKLPEDVLEESDYSQLLAIARSFGDGNCNVSEYILDHAWMYLKLKELFMALYPEYRCWALKENGDEVVC